MYKNKILSAVVFILTFSLLTGCSRDVIESSNITSVESSTYSQPSSNISSSSNSVSSKKTNTSTESTVKVSSYSGNINFESPIQITEMSQKEIIEVYEQESGLDLPDSIKLEPGGEVDFVYIPHEDKGYCESLIVFTNLVANISKSEATNILNQLKKSVEWKTEILIPRKSIQKAIKDISSEKYDWYGKNIPSLVNNSLYSLQVCIIEDDKTGEYMMVTDGITNNRTYKNGLITIK